MSSANVIVERQGDTAAVLSVPAGGGGGEITLAQSPPARAQPRPAAPVRSVQPRQPMPPRRLPPSRVPAREMRDTFGGLANPSKLLPPEDDEDDFDDDDDEGFSDEGSDPGSGGGSGDGGSEDGGSGDEDVPDLPDDEHEPFEDELKPSEGFRTLEEEKADIMFKLSRLKKQGLPGLRQFTVHSDIRDMRTELKRIKTELELDSSIKFQRKMLMAVVSGLEFVNKKYSPLELQLDGWSETVHENIGDYDSVFEELYFKYRGKVKMPPEVSLILMVGGSALMFHYTNTMLKTALPAMNPAALQGMQNMFANMQAQQPQQPMQQAQQAQQQAQQPQQPQNPMQQPMQPMQPQRQPMQQPMQPQQPGGGERRAMRGPGMDLGALLGGLPPIMPVMPPPMPARQPAPRPVIVETPATAGARDDDDAQSDRLSDVVSEDLQSVPEDLQSVASDLGGGGRKRGVKEVTLSEPGKKRGRRAGATKNVVVI